MIEVLTYSLAVIAGLILLLGGALAAYRLIPRREAPPDVQSLWAEVQANRTAILDLTDKYETQVQRSRGRKRWKDREEDEPTAPVLPAPPVLSGKAALRERARQAYPKLVGGGD